MPLDSGSGWLPVETMPVHALRRAAQNIRCAGDGIHARQEDGYGSATLRKILLARLSREGVEAVLDQVILTGSCMQALDFLCRHLLDPGDTVLVDDPCCRSLLPLLRTHQVRIVGVPYTPVGPDTVAFQATLISEKPKIYITNTAIHNPTGASLSPRVAHKVVSLAAAHDVLIVENDVFADFELKRSPRLAALDGLQGVIRVGSFSKTISPSVRCGYIAARKHWIESLLNLQAATGALGACPVAAEVVSDVLSNAAYWRYMSVLRDRLALDREAAISRLAPLGIVPWCIPTGGFFLWCRLPDGCDSTLIASKCAEEAVILAPGNAFSSSQTAGNFLRFNAALLKDPRIFSALERAVGLRR